jgi:hypothetical protein
VGVSIENRRQGVYNLVFFLVDAYKAIKLSNLKSYTREARDKDVSPYKKNAVEEISTKNIKSRDSAASNELDTILQ